MRSFARALSAGVLLTLLALAVQAAPGERTLHNFIGGKQGAFPGALTAGPDGTLYGMTQPFGSGDGAVFAVRPPAQGNAWTISVLYRFRGGRDGEGGDGHLLLDSQGRLFGLTTSGGAFGGGSAFMLTPGQGGALPWTRTELTVFGPGHDDGFFPVGGLTADSTGNLYGATFYGGGGTCPVGCGTVFRLEPPARDGAPWHRTVLYAFQGKDDGAAPPGPVRLEPGGALIGTASAGGRGICQNGCGTVWRLAPDAHGDAWQLTPLHRFSGAEGAGPIGAPLADGAGNLYVNLPFLGPFGQGAVVRVSPPVIGGGSWSSTVLHGFRGSPDGGAPIDSLIQAPDGTLYGATEFGGASEQGTVFALSPPPPWNKRWREHVVHSFRIRNDGRGPLASVVFGLYGELYGTTFQGGRANLGTVYQLRR